MTTSNPRYIVKKVTSEEQVREILACLRKEDLAELAVNGHTDLEAYPAQLMEYLQTQPANPLAMEAAYLPDGRPLAIGGCAYTPSGKGYPWFLCTTHSESHKATLFRAIKEKHKEWVEAFPEQYGLAWVGNWAHITLIKHMGYTIADTCHQDGRIDFWR